MPCLDNLLNSPPGLSSRPELKPILSDAQLDLELNPAVVREPDPDGFLLGPQLAESCVDDKQEECEFRGNSGGEGGPIELESDPEKDLGSIFQSKFRSEAIDGDGIERALIPCRVIGPTTAKLVQPGVSDFNCSLPFLAGPPNSVVSMLAGWQVQCRVCQNIVCPEPDEKIVCSVRGCQGVFHLTCAKENLKFSSSKQFKCPQHIDQVKPFVGGILLIAIKKRLAKRIDISLFSMQHEVPANNLEDVFALLPLPYNVEEFKIDKKWKDQTETKENVVMLMMILDAQAAVLQIALMVVCAGFSASAAQKLVVAPKTTERCGWGVVAAESISKEDFIVEYVGEVIDDAMCERRLWDMKDQDAKNFYMCEINKDFVIDATFKGNASRFLNHSCAPNCKLEKWQVEGEVRVGVFASKSIKVGEALTYDYRFVQFGPEVECRCGAPSCNGYLGTKRKIVFAPKTKRKAELVASWGPKRQRTTKRYFDDYFIDGSSSGVGRREFKGFGVSEERVHLVTNSEGRPAGEALVEFVGMSKDRMMLGAGMKEASEPTPVLRMRGLPFLSGRDDISDFFKNFTLPEDAIHITCNFEGRPTGEAFVEFASEEDAKEALAKDRRTPGSCYIELFPSSSEELNEATSRGR
ncbi:histone-lysine n-methyltransferase ashr3 [Phtheirospermum japonicum]|uniref:Histone-lysine n-methyltransferase ashr3 n=1 Tax=Phtheirospermum japonicum TaxID=374723 RepID=A0A830CNM1_9LAMI|nr:histone-lysine n-methyltransferase ashr3 [Phtheirospermum japonicum]